MFAIQFGRLNGACSVLLRVVLHMEPRRVSRLVCDEAEHLGVLVYRIVHQLESNLLVSLVSVHHPLGQWLERLFDVLLGLQIELHSLWSKLSRQCKVGSPFAWR